MALSGTVLAAAIKAKLQAKLPDFAAVIGDDLDEFVAAIAEATVEHVTANGQVIVTSVSGVTTGAGVSGPGTGTIV